VIGVRVFTWTGVNTTSVGKFQSTSLVILKQQDTDRKAITHEIRMTFWTIQADPEFRQFGVL